ncbi:capsular associated protein [Colletotrichum paranaense]|uniref:Capsular associated protein n=1 Tax=Colletotrichum paranaense TaxID=1914294 RepID=A0ABQ9T5N8_9PEZI|nr:capsular associated protein [Colletotrichum paranaense]KAK1547061.1 capsular associated protein [Colletotrichum paranaense]
MARDAQIHLTALCVVGSFLWISSNVEGHSLIEYPRLSSVLILLLSGGLTWLASYLAAWLPGADGRFDERAGSKSTFEQTIPARPRRYFAPLLIFCIFLRLEVFHRVTAQLQCSVPGVQSFLCIYLVLYHILYYQRARPPPPEEDPWASIGDDIAVWANGSRTLALGSACLFSYGTFVAISQDPRSTFFCSALSDSRMTTLAFQLLGLFLDAVIVSLFWRILAWTKTTRLRLRTLGTILALSGVFIKVFQILISPLVSASEGYPTSFSGINSLYIFDIFIDSFAFAVLVTSLSILVYETNPVTPTSIITFICGLTAATQNIMHIGKWQMESRLSAIGPLYLLVLGYSMFLYSTNVRSLLFIPRALILVLMVSMFVGMTIYGLLKSATVKQHPLNRLIYDVRVESDRWMRHAMTSDNLNVAVDVYHERHYGRDPPPNFDKWYEFAKARKSVIIDHFEQMESDILPFWGVKPEAIRQAYNERVPKEPHIAMVTIENKQVSHNYEGNDANKKVLDELVAMIGGFVEHLSDMKLPINLSNQPRVLTPWSELNRYTLTGMKQKFKLLSSRSMEDASAGGSGEIPSPEGNVERNAESKAVGGSPAIPQSKQAMYESTKAWRDMEASVCPTNTPGRSGLHWNVRDFCTSCVKWHEDEQFMWNYPQSKSLCDQQDLTRLHSFHTSAPPIKPVQELLPIFGRFKADGFNDILLPLMPLTEDEPEHKKDFRQRKDSVYWRGKIGEKPISDEALRGNHKHRLVHLVNNATAAEDVTMMLGAPSKGSWYAYEIVRAREANAILPFDIGIAEYACDVKTPGCGAARAELGQKPVAASGEDPLDHRYVMLLDEDTAPPLQMLRTLRSPGSVPLMSSVFGEWYSERLIPWLHFVPVDTRFHALHSTVAYFVGLKGRGKLNGREVDFEARWEDAEWIATQGARWVDKALRREDMEIYLFRLLLEWGRVVRDDRDSIGFKVQKS